MEKRLLLAFFLSAIIFVVWSFVFPPPKRAPRPQQATATHAATVQTKPASATPKPVPQAARANASAAGTPAPVSPVACSTTHDIAKKEETIVVDNGLLKLRLDNRGAAITSLILKKYDDDEGNPLDLVQRVTVADRTYPLQLVVDGRPDQRLYTMTKTGNGYRFHWCDGTSEVTKTIRLVPESYRIDISVTVAGEEPAAVVSVGTGMRNIGKLEKANRFATWGNVAVYANDKLERFKRKKVRAVKEVALPPMGFAGFEDTYFLNVMRPVGTGASVRIVPLELPPKPEKVTTRTRKKKEKKKKPGERTVLEVLIASPGHTFQAELFSGPKEYNLLQKVDHGIEKTLHFGIFNPISVFFLKVLRWIYSLVGNYGIAIILLTLLIRIVLFPFMHKSTVSMRKMQKVQPKVKAIQERYKKHKGDPQMRAKMNQEMMELYKVEGVNPMGGCLPMLIQLPILWALYTLFAYSITMRHAPFIWWIHDLSAKDPYYITPILMTFTMWLQQKLAPQAGDAQQQKMFRLMPLIFGIMFLGFPSGLVLYWLTNNVLTILQQEVTFSLMGERKGTKKGGKPKRKKA
ncbi:MAG: membrane protein insertase YidC [Acidobacteria bacterium]|nr:membrane protein insertase YidC [Acidobacteriota bacterium]